MVVDSGFMCKKCGKVYHTKEQYLPIYCKKCGEDLVDKRYSYNLTKHNGKIVETRESNIFGGYDYVKTVLSDNVARVKLRRKALFFWRLFRS